MKKTPLKSGPVRPELSVLVQHLSSEITAHTVALQQFRSRVNLPVFLGPFVVLGFLAGSGSSVQVVWDCSAYLAAGLVTVSFVGLGVTCAVIESHTWRQCNVWRRQIYDIYTNPKDALATTEPNFSENLLGAYVLVYVVLLVAMSGVVALLSKWLVVAA